ncbi:hypothetical protein BU17DRAFT_81201 [Hysterangium stoloniferum]|nr:hypothetical protein BU17DRAFT_81201 [Hysterangium stoloniferum]
MAISYSHAPLDAILNAKQVLRTPYEDHRQTQISSRSGSSKRQNHKTPALRNYVGRSRRPPNDPISSVSLKGQVATLYDFPAQRPKNLAFGTLWMGSEPDVDQTFLLWDHGLGYVPNKVVYAAVRAFEAGIKIGIMPAELKSGLVHLVAVAMLKNRLSTSGATVPQIEYLLLEAYDDLKSQDRVLSHTGPDEQSPQIQRRHWLWGSICPCTQELEWLKYQSERRWWELTKRDSEIYLRRLQEPPDSELDMLFYAYIQPIAFKD